MLSMVDPPSSGERTVEGIACIREGEETREEVKLGPAPEGGSSIHSPGAIDAGGEMLSDARVDHASKECGVSETMGSA